MTCKPRPEDATPTGRDGPQPAAAASGTTAAPPVPPIWWPDDPVPPPDPSRPAEPARTAPVPAARPCAAPTPPPQAPSPWALPGWPDDWTRRSAVSLGLPSLLPSPHRIAGCLGQIGWRAAPDWILPLYFAGGGLPPMDAAVRESLPSLLPNPVLVGRLLREIGWPLPSPHSRPAVPWTPPEPFGPPRPDAQILAGRIPTGTARQVAGHLRWLAQALEERSAHGLALSHNPLRSVLHMLSPAQQLRVADAWAARLRSRLAHRLHEPVPAKMRRRHAHSSGPVLRHYERDRELYTLLRMQSRPDWPWLPALEMQHGISLQPDGAYRLTPDCAPRLLELAACVEEVADLPPQPPRPKVRPRGVLYDMAHLVADRVQGYGVALHEALLRDEMAEVHIDLLQGTVTPDPAPHRSSPWMRDLAEFVRRPALHASRGWHIAQADLRRAPGSAHALLLRITLETWRDAWHVELEQRFTPFWTKPA